MASKERCDAPVHSPPQGEEPDVDGATKDELKEGASLLNQAASAVFVFIQDAAGDSLRSHFSVAPILYSSGS